MLRRKIVPSLVALILIFNRSATKLIPGGGVFEVSVMLLAAKKPFSLQAGLKKFLPALLMLAYSSSILILETLRFGFDLLAVRRAMLGLYAIVPVILLCYRVEISEFVNKYLLQISLILFVAVLMNFSDFQPTMAAQVSACFILANLVFKCHKLAACVFVVSFILSASGASSGQSPYRTPILTLILAISVFAFFAIRQQRMKRNAVITFVVLSLILVTLVLTGILNRTIGSVLVGVGGLLDNQAIFLLGSELGGVVESTRGDAFGTAQTRVIFWSSILDYQFSNFGSLLFGYGLQDGFMDVTLPYVPFNNKNLVDPHNSYLNIFFRFGLIGVFLYVWLLSKVMRSVVVHIEGWTRCIPFFLVSLLFAFFEVALENPHGNLIFWFILLMPVFSMNDELNKGAWVRHERNSIS